MINTRCFPRRARSLLLLGICLLILGAVPTRQAQAIIVPQSVDNSLQDFTAGTFQRTSLGSQIVSSPPAPLPKVADQTGAVQLVPLGILSQWFESPFNLPEKMTDIGAVAIGSHIFAIGGLVSNARTAHVWSTGIDQTTGAPIGWQAETSLPAVQASIAYPTPVAARSVPAVAAVETSSNNGFIYVMGGSVRPSGTPDTISSYAVNIAQVANGRIISWSAGPPIPDTDGSIGDQVGLQSASALSLSTGGKTYIYLIGGLQRYVELQNIREFGSKQVYYAQVRPNGQLVKPSSGQPGWDMLAPIPINDPEGVRGLWDGTAVSDHFDIGNGPGGGVGGDVLYVMGGQTRPLDLGQEYNGNVYRALINSSNGALTWTSAAGPNQWQGTLPEARIGMGSVEFRGNLYLTGGRPISGGVPAAPEKSVLTSYIEDDLTLAQLGQGSNFLRNNPDPLRSPRVHHGTVIVPATPTVSAPNAAYVYVIGGQGVIGDIDTSDDQGSEKVTYGKIGGTDRPTNGFAPTGWFYSAAHSINFDGAQLQQINWTTAITRTSPTDPAMDVQMQYRTSAAADCTLSTAFDGALWQDLDGSPNDSFRSVNSGNSVSLGALPVARCFQYRAYLTSASRAVTPALLNVSILVQVPGSPDLKVSSINDLHSGDGSLTGLTVSILNHNDFPNSPTRAADSESQGSFFVDLFVFYQDEPVIQPSVPLSAADKARSKAYANISKSDMGPDKQLTITQWCDANPAISGCQTINLLTSVFARPGTYTVIAVVDSIGDLPGGGFDPSGYVHETPSGAEQNNTLQKNNIQVPRVRFINYLPLTFGKK